MPRLEMIDSPKSVAEQTMEVVPRNDLLPSSLSSQPAQSACNAKTLAATQQKTDTVYATAAAVSFLDSAWRSIAKSQHECGVGVVSQSSSTSCRKQRWNQLVRKSVRLPITSDDEIGGISAAATNGTQSRENENAVTMACSVNNESQPASCRTPSMSSSSSCSPRLCIDSFYETESSAHDCHSRSTVSPLSSSSSSSSRTKRRRLNADCTTATITCSRFRDADSCPPDRHHSRYCCHVRRGCRRCCCCCTCPHQHCEDSRRAFQDDERYGATPPTYRQSGTDQPPVNVAQTEQYVFPRGPTSSTQSSYFRKTPGTARRAQTAGVFGLDQPFDGTPPVMLEHLKDSFDARLATVDHPRSSSSSIVAHANNTTDMRSSSTRSVLTSVESCLIPLEPVTGVSLSADPRRLRHWQLATNVIMIRTDVDKVDVTQPSKVNRH